MNQKLISELLDNIVKRIDEEAEMQDADLAYVVYVTDPREGTGDMRFYGDMDALLALSMRAQKALFDNLDVETDVVNAVEAVLPDMGGLTMDKLKYAQDRLNEMADEDPDFDFDEQENPD